jgi:hypothetical protein
LEPKRLQGSLVLDVASQQLGNVFKVASILFGQGFICGLQKNGRIDCDFGLRRGNDRDLSERVPRMVKELGDEILICAQLR